MSEEALYINEQQPEEDQLDNDFRVIVLEQPKGQDGAIEVEQSDLKEILLDGIRTFTGINEFFDSFDEKVAYPNEGKLKYDVGSDGFIVIVVETAALKQEVTKFIEEYVAALPKAEGAGEEQNEADEEESDGDNDGGSRKKSRK